jgi:hypothetical protein
MISDWFLTIIVESLFKTQGLEPTLSIDRLEFQGLEPTLSIYRLKVQGLEPTLSIHRLKIMDRNRQCRIIGQNIKARTDMVDLSGHFLMIGAKLCSYRYHYKKSPQRYIPKQ